MSRRYEHYLCQDFPDNGDSILRQMHVELFAEWLNFRLEQQEKDIRLWLRWLGHTPEEGAGLLKRVEKRASSLIPQQYRREPERTLFLSDLRLVVRLIDLEIAAGLSRIWLRRPARCRGSTCRNVRTCKTRVALTRFSVPVCHFENYLA